MSVPITKFKSCVGNHWKVEIHRIAVNNGGTITVVYICMKCGDTFKTTQNVVER